MQKRNGVAFFNLYVREEEIMTRTRISVAVLTLFILGVTSTRAQRTHDAIIKGNLNQLKSLLAEEPKLVTAKDKQGRTLLHIAAAKGQKEVVELLIAKGADVNAKEKSGQTALLAAAMQGYREIVKTLLVNGADVNAKEEAGGKIFLAQVRGNAYKVAVMQAKGEFVSGMTALMFASGFGHESTVKDLIAHGADVNLRDKGGRTALMFASKNGKDKVVEMLLAEGADVHARAMGGFFFSNMPDPGSLPGLSRPLWKTLDAIASPDVGEKRNNGWTALSLAKNQGNTSTTLLLKKAGAKE